MLLSNYPKGDSLLTSKVYENLGNLPTFLRVGQPATTKSVFLNVNTFAGAFIVVTLLEKNFYENAMKNTALKNRQNADFSIFKKTTSQKNIKRNAEMEATSLPKGRDYS